jgi:hypothetical protein
MCNWDFSFLENEWESADSSKGGSEYALVPEGEHRCVVDRVGIEASRFDPDIPTIAFHLKIQEEGEWDGRRLWYNFNLDPKREGLVHRLARLLEIFGVEKPARMADLEVALCQINHQAAKATVRHNLAKNGKTYANVSWLEGPEQPDEAVSEVVSESATVLDRGEDPEPDAVESESDADDNAGETPPF